MRIVKCDSGRMLLILPDNSTALWDTRRTPAPPPQPVLSRPARKTGLFSALLDKVQSALH